MPSLCIVQLQRSTLQKGALPEVSRASPLPAHCLASHCALHWVSKEYVPSSSFHLVWHIKVQRVIQGVYSEEY